MNCKNLTFSDKIILCKCSVKYIPSCHCEVAKGSRGNLRIMEFTPREKTEIASLTLAMTWFTEYLPYYIVVNRIFCLDIYLRKSVS